MSQGERLRASVIISMRNSASTIEHCLQGVSEQDYPIDEIIVIDNASRDDSVALVEKFSATSRIPLRLIRQSVDKGIGNSYNTGAELAVAPLLILMHSDGAFPSPHEVERLAAPLCDDEKVVAAYPVLLMPQPIWERFPYWQKYLFSRVMGRKIHSMCGKFDCIRKEIFLAVGGFNIKRFTPTCGYGGEDADAHHRISKMGVVAKSDAQVIHLHDLSRSYDLIALFQTRKMLSRTYAKVLLFQGFHPTPGKLTFFVRPALALLPFIPHLFWSGIALQFLFSLANSWRMYTSRSTLLDIRILALPFIDIALIYYEAFWFLEGLLTPPADAKCSD